MKLSLTQMIAGAALMGLLTSCALPSPNAASTTTAPVITPMPSNQVIADARILPARYVELSFDVGGTVDAIYVEEGDIINDNAPLAQLSTQEYELLLAERQASLAQAQAHYELIKAGATPAQIAAQEAQVRNAQAQLERSQSGNITSADIASAQARVREAQAQLAALKNPSAGDISAAQLRVTQAQTSLEAIRSSASTGKTSAELALQRAADALTQAQASYATAAENWGYVRDTGADPTNPKITDPATGKTRDNKLNDVQERQYYEAFVQAEAALRSAEKAVEQSRLAYDQARQDEITQIQQAEAALADAQQQLNALANPDANVLAQAQARVDQARANLVKLQQGGTTADIAVAQAQVEQAQANLEELTSPPRDVDLAEARARVDAAEVAVRQAEYNLAQATLRAPFAGIIAERQLEIGQRVAPGATGSMTNAPFVLADPGVWKIETENLNERDIVRIQTGSTAEITFEALSDVTLTGTVSAIEPRGRDQYGDITYTVTITPDTWDERLRWNMSATVAIVTDSR